MTTGILVALSVAALVMVAWELRPDRLRGPNSWRVSMFAWSVLRNSVPCPTVLVFTTESCGGCSPVALWRQEWEHKLDEMTKVPVRFVIVGNGGISVNFVTLVRRGIRAFPTLAVLESDYRVLGLEVGFRRPDWDAHVQRLMCKS